jgi:hypothetical protein
MLLMEEQLKEAEQILLGLEASNAVPSSTMLLEKIRTFGTSSTNKKSVPICQHIIVGFASKFILEHAGPIGISLIPAPSFKIW